MRRPLPIHLVGNVDLDIVLGPVAPWPEAGTERIVERRRVGAGGAAGVAALALQGLGAPFQLHARVGDDAFGALLRQELGAAGAQLEVVAESTAFSVGVSHPSGERTFLTHLGHLAELDVAAIAAALERSRPGLVLLCGYFLLPPLRRGGGLELLRRARLAGHRTLFDGGWPSEGFTDAVRAELDALLPWVDVVLPNEAEARAWAGAADLAGAFEALERHGARALVKRGAAGASWRAGEVVRTAPAPPGRVGDTVGAGDCFNAALLAELSRGAAPGAAVAGAVAYASAVLAREPRDYGRLGGGDGGP